MSSTYKALQEITREDEDLINWNGIWNKCIPLQVILFVWKSIQNKVPSEQNLVTRGIFIMEQEVSSSRLKATKTQNRLFFMCEKAVKVWYYCFKWMSLSSIICYNFFSHMLHFCGFEWRQSAGTQQVLQLYGQLGWVGTKLCFNNQAWKLQRFLNMLLFYLGDG